MSFLHGLGLAGLAGAVIAGTVLCSVPSTGFSGSSGRTALGFAAGTARSSAVLGLTT